MELSLLIVSFFTVMFCMFNKKYKVSLLTLFCFIWFLVFLLYSFRWYGLYDCKESTFKVYLIGIISFFIGYVIVPPVKRNLSYLNKDKFGNTKRLILVILSIVSIFILLYKSYKTLPYWLSGGSGAVKEVLLTDDVTEAGVLGQIIYTFIARPFQIIIVIYAIVNIFERKKDTLIIWLAVFLTLSGYICSASKTAVSEMIFMVFAFVFLFGKLSIRDLFKKYRRLSLAIFLLLTLLFSIMAIDAAAGDSHLGQGLYVYFCGCMPCSDNALSEMQGNPYFYGLISLNGVLRAFNLIPTILGLPNFKEVIDLGYYYMMNFEHTINIADDIPYNAFISLFSYFYADGGEVGVAVLSFIFGLSCALVMRRSYKKPSLCNSSLVLLLAFFIFLSMVRIETFLTPYAMAIFYIAILFPRRNIEIKY